jgi:hypothetical protein
MPNPVSHIVYVSTAVAPMPESALEDLLAVSRIRNGMLGITGVLFYCGGNFIHALEGPKIPVENLYRVIRADPRHRAVTTLVAIENDNRDFPDWAMAYCHVKHAEIFDGITARLNDIMATRNSDPDLAIYQLLIRFLQNNC